MLRTLFRTGYTGPKKALKEISAHSVELWDADDLDGDGWPSTGSVVHMTPGTWGKAPSIAYAVTFYTSEIENDYRMFLFIDADEDGSYDYPGQSDEFTATAGETVTDIDFYIYEYP